MEQIPPSPVVPIRQTPSSSPPIDPPRAVTTAARRLVWLEPHVRRWWLLALLIVVMFITYFGDCLWARKTEQHLLDTGIKMQAKMVAAESKLTGHPVGPGDFVQLQLNFPGQGEELVVGHLNITHGVVGENITVHVDPADHTRWTDRNEPTPLLDSLLVGLLVLPIIPIVLFLAYRQARSLLSTWQNGASATAVIFDRKQSPIAPMSYALRCSLPNSRNKELFTVYVPRIGYGLEKGDLIWVLSSTQKGRPLAALWMAGASV